MRKETTLDQWKVLYEVTTRIKELKPWENFWDMDLIGVLKEDDAIVMLADILIGFIFQFGAPKEIRVTNVITGARLEQICDVCGIKLRRVKRLPGLDEFKYSLGRFGY